jgi:hypothetical protein
MIGMTITNDSKHISVSVRFEDGNSRNLFFKVLTEEIYNHVSAVETASAKIDLGNYIFKCPEKRLNKIAVSIRWKRS